MVVQVAVVHRRVEMVEAVARVVAAADDNNEEMLSISEEQY